MNAQFKQTAGLIKYTTELDHLNSKASFLISGTSDIGKSISQFPEKKITIYPRKIVSLSQLKLSYKELWLVKLYHHY
ncbi:hypothetical protein CJF42_10460 [Pseudoalteromonas sp. NBT06-2]|uniref:hypothetical protein n=1 Tax=Pseudoalteromonas sp. NBT06-2 TaxID=2025950 RepID=UPI000BA6DFF0|nr:hypothetical protein [Pseudoalteromonas sp. NBT06-2]PAJ74423.1 hypothetical protein CJF42_10460 [Pseudoalteromonas sp. NBT06-2]